MDYALHYDRLIDRARSRQLAGYVEHHHIVPRCLGGGDESINIVALTAEEHFVAHQLLVKMHPAHIGLIWALSAMCNATRVQKRSNKRYGWLRRKFAKTLSERYSGKQLSPEHRAKLSAAAKTRVRPPHSAETRAKMSLVATGRKKSAAHCASMSASRTGKRQGQRSAEARARMSAAQQACAHRIDRSYQQTAEYRAKQAENMNRIWTARRAAREA